MLVIVAGALALALGVRTVSFIDVVSFIRDF
jgi:hypothetical protein